MFASKAGAYPTVELELLKDASLRKALALLINIRLQGWKGLTVTHTLAYYEHWCL
jgi:hypothetical protein